MIPSPVPATGRVGDAEQGKSLGAHRLLHHGLLAQLWYAQRIHDGHGHSANGAVARRAAMDHQRTTLWIPQAAPSPEPILKEVLQGEANLNLSGCRRK